MAKIKVSDYIAKRLKETHKIENFFMVSGGGAMHLNNSLGRYLDYIANHHEQASAIAAEGYFRASGKVAVVNVTTGPGGLNCLNGIMGQWTDSVPVLYISGQVKFSTTISSCPNIPLRQLGDQEVDIINIVKPLTKYAVMITDPLSVKYHLDKAIYEASTGRFGPVWLDIPMNIQSAMIEENELIDFIPEKRNNKNDNKITEVISLLKQSKRPLIVAGHGIRLSNTVDLLKQITKNTDIPIATTFNAIDIIEENNKNFIGRIGSLGQRGANFTLQNCDLLICLGTRNNIRQVSYNCENYAKNAKKIAVDIDAAELEKPTITLDLKINSDLKDFLPDFAKHIDKFECSEWLDFCKKLKNKYSFDSYDEYKNKNEKINVYTFTKTLTDILPEKAILIAANGTACVSLFQVGNVNSSQRIFWNSGDASMGYELPASIGASVANPQNDIIVLAGDGSIMMNLQELQTIKHNNLPIKIFVINNGAYASIQQTQKRFFDGHMTGSGIESGVSVPDFEAVGKAFGLKTVRIKTSHDLKEQIDKVLNTQGAILCEVFVDKDYSFVPKLTAKKLPDGSMVSASFENMAPFLSDIELQENMIK
ncbi:MAG: thiamine pyrophosphate-binding protein [Candidatus Gastranaerophilales bacterium]|nr:thiamine pyrophosphate-binding protein [Candidatus Gastranaerophilales bacterium]